MSKDITEDILLKAGFTKKTTYSIVCPKYYSIKLSNIHIGVYNISNMPTRSWNVKVFSSKHFHIADIDIQSIDHFNKLMELMDIDFRLKEEEL